ncbi:MAG: pyridoxal-phosphate dependent enzyme [Balneolaceae bacterium]|nr:pyridoxal-phosphate dependent enzyme [Balneolaceae bacterium]
MPAALEAQRAYKRISKEPEFTAQLANLLRDYAGRPTPRFTPAAEPAPGRRRCLPEAGGLDRQLAHKINNTLGQALLAHGWKKIIAETGAGQHGVATATAAALFGMGCKIFMGVEDIQRQAPNVRRMELLGAEVHPVDSGTATERTP